jgi:hypothetical protein
MGWCAEFGCRIRDGCDHPMAAGRKACTCPDCAVVCKGRFTGCPEVWAAGPRTGSQPVLKLATNMGSSAPSASAPPAPPARRPEPVAVVLPPDERVTVVLDSIRHDVEGVHVDLNDTILGVKELRAAVADMGRTASANIESLRRELASVTQLLTRQQATLDKLVESQAAQAAQLAQATQAAQSAQAAGTPDVRSSYEKLVEERRAKMAAAGAAAAAAAAAAAGDTSNGNGHLGPVRRGLLPHIQRALHHTAPTDPQPQTSLPEPGEADRPTP